MNTNAIKKLLLILLVLSSAGYFIQSLYYTTPVHNTGQEKQPVKESGNDKKAAKAVDYDGIVNKNIFSPDRKYVEKPGQNANGAPGTPPPVMPEMDLQGIVQGPDGEYIAYISIGGKKPQPVRSGERLDDIKVVSITMADVTMKWFQSEVKLTLSKVKSMGKKR
jgi:hypothetical protein